MEFSEDISEMRMSSKLESMMFLAEKELFTKWTWALCVPTKGYLASRTVEFLITTKGLSQELFLESE